MMMAMTETRFRAVLDAYGADPARWPEAERAAATAFLAAHPQVATALLDAAALDQRLDAAPTQDPSAALMGRVLAAAPSAGAGAGAGVGARWRELTAGVLGRAGPWTPQRVGRAGCAARARIAGGLALALLASVGVGYSLGALHATRGVGETLIDVAFTSAYTGWRLDG